MFFTSPVFVMIFFGGLIPILGALALSNIIPEWRWDYVPFHAVVEGLGAFAALIIATLVMLMRSAGKLHLGYVWVACGLVAMGVLDGFHAVLNAGGTFVWLHSFATFIGGILFSLIWLPKRISDHQGISNLPLYIFIVSVIGGFVSLGFSATLPMMVENGRFTWAAQSLNIVGGIGFLVAAAYFVMGRAEVNKSNKIIFSTQAFLFGIAALLFELSELWDSPWWLWHVLRLIAYMVVVYYFLTIFLQMGKKIKDSRDNLEKLVQERTRDLDKLSQAVEQSPSMMFITDINGTIEYANQKFYEVSGYQPEEVIGKTPNILQSQSTPRSLYKDLWDTITSGKVWRGELTDRCKNGETFWANAMIAPILSREGEITHFFASHEDITKRKIAEREMLQAKEHAEIANRAKSHLMANTSHELRTPLNAIIGFSSTMKEEIFGPIHNEKYLEYLNDIHESGLHLLDLINDILDVSAMEGEALKLHEEKANLNNLIADAVRLINPRAIKGSVEVLTSTGFENLQVYVDQRRIKQILLNLLSNAVKFTPKNGHVTVQKDLNADGSFSLTILDTGIGMDEEGLVKAMSPFGQVDSGLNRTNEGTGLGLPLTKGLIELHGGTLTIESELDKGTTVKVTLPKERVLL